MNLNALESVLFEIKKYNLQETILFIKNQLSYDEARYTKQLLLRQSLYNRMDEDERRQLGIDIFHFVMGCNLNLSNPETFSEKIQWIKFNDITQLMTKLVDKYAVRSWVSERIGEEYLIPLLGAWNKVGDINWDALPNQFCLKTTHGSAMNYVVTDKSQIDLNDIKSKFAAWLRRPFEMVAYEMQYRDVPRRIIAEQYIEGMDGKLFDYKIHCFEGEPVFIQCIGERNPQKHTAYHEHYDLEWKKLDWNFECFPRFPYEVPKPRQLDDMLRVARVLSEGFRYVRVDLYEITGHVYFGEMTFTPGSGMYKYQGTWNYEQDNELGQLLKL